LDLEGGWSDLEEDWQDLGLVVELAVGEGVHSVTQP